MVNYRAHAAASSPRLHSPADFVRWAFASRLDPRAYRVTPADVIATEEDVALVKRLREAIWAGAWALATGSSPAAEDARTINEVARGAVPVPQIGPDDIGPLNLKKLY